MNFVHPIAQTKGLMNTFQLINAPHYGFGGWVLSQKLKDPSTIASRTLASSADSTNAFKKGGKITRQKQKQKQTQIVHIHNAPAPRKRAPARRKQNSAPIILPPQFTSVPSGYIHRPEAQQPAASALIDRLDGIERRLTQSIGSQVPVKLPEAPEPVAIAMSAFTPNQKIIDDHDELHQQIPKILPEEHDEQVAAVAASSTEDDEPGHVIETPQTKELVSKVVGGKPLYNTGLTYKTKRQSYEIALTAGGTIYLKPTNDGKWTSLSAAVKGTHISEVQRIVADNDLKYPKQ